MTFDSLPRIKSQPTSHHNVDESSPYDRFHGIDELEGAWQHMLGHQLPSLPPVESFWNALPEFFAWLEEAAVPAMRAAYVAAPGETVIRERTLSLSLRAGVQTHLEIIRFAASNRLCIDLDYQGRTRRIEPYSLRRTQDGNIILHAWSVEKDEHRSYRVDRIEGARTTSQTFTPRYAIELTPAGPVNIPPTSRTTSAGVSAFRSARPARTRSQSFGPTYVYECSYCGKRFRRKNQSTSLNPHKDRNGYPCPGRTGFWVDTQY